MRNSSKDVLIVEDDSIRNLVALALTRAGLRCDTELRDPVKGCVVLQERHDGLDARSAERGLS